MGGAGAAVYGVVIYAQVRNYRSTNLPTRRPVIRHTASILYANKHFAFVEGTMLTTLLSASSELTSSTVLETSSAVHGCTFFEVAFPTENSTSRFPSTKQNKRR